MLVVMLARLLFPELGWQNIEGIFLGAESVPLVAESDVVDVRYLPTFIASAGCLFYCWQFFRNFLCRLRSAESTTYLALLGGPILGTFVGTIVPHFWMAIVGFAGFVIGTRIGVLFWKRDIRLLHRKNLLTDTATHTMVNMLLYLCFGIGLGYMSYWGTSVSSVNANHLRTVDMLFALATCGFIFKCWRTHGTRHKSAILLGICDRIVERTDHMTTGRRNPGARDGGPSGVGLHDGR